MSSLVWRQIISVYTHYVVHVYETLLSEHLEHCEDAKLRGYVRQF
jgi:hypothetical protein